MKMSNNTILITGGTSGIGYALAAQFLERGNTVLITGRAEEKLAAARQSLPGVHTYVSDVSDPAAIRNGSTPMLSARSRTSMFSSTTRALA